MPKVSASILNCNNAFLGEAVQAADRGGADFIHIDIMDGSYVDNFTFGPKTVSDIKALTNVPLEVHFELFSPDRYVKMFAEAGADIIIFPLDCCVNPIRTLNLVKSFGKKAGLTINPAVGIDMLPYLAHHLDYLILLSVEPGFGGQKFEKTVLNKIVNAKKILQELGAQVPVAVDGGVNFETAPEIVKHGADILIAGTSIFLSGNVQENIARFKNMQ